MSDDTLNARWNVAMEALYEILRVTSAKKAKRIAREAIETDKALAEGELLSTVKEKEANDGP